MAVYPCLRGSLKHPHKFGQPCNNDVFPFPAFFLVQTISTTSTGFRSFRRSITRLLTKTLGAPSMTRQNSDVSEAKIRRKTDVGGRCRRHRCRCVWKSLAVWFVAVCCLLFPIVILIVWYILIGKWIHFSCLVIQTKRGRRVSHDDRQDLFNAPSQQKRCGEAGRVCGIFGIRLLLVTQTSRGSHFKTIADDDFVRFCMMFLVGVLFYWQPVSDDGRCIFWIFGLVSYGKRLCALMTQMLNAITTYLNIGQFKQAVSIRYLPCQCWRLTRSTYSDGGDSPDGISSVPLERRLRSWPRGLNKDWPRWLNSVYQF